MLEKRDDGKMWMARVTLRPRVEWGGDAPDEAAIADLHHRAHEACFIANSVTTKMVVESCLTLHCESIEALGLCRSWIAASPSAPRNDGGG